MAAGCFSAMIVTRALWALLYIAIAANVGLGVGMIVRHSAGAISGRMSRSNFSRSSAFVDALFATASSG